MPEVRTDLHKLLHSKGLDLHIILLKEREQALS
jgi:hypothetical protein